MPRVFSWLSRLFLEYHCRLSKKTTNFLAFPAFSRLLEVKKHGKAKKARSSGLFLALQAFSGFFLQGISQFVSELIE